MGVFRLCIIIYIYSNFVHVCVGKTCDWFFMSMFHLGKDINFVGFLRFLSSFLFGCVVTDRSTLSVERRA